MDNLTFFKRIIRKHPIETVLLLFAFLTTFLTSLLWLKSNGTVLAANETKPVLINASEQNNQDMETSMSDNIYVEVSGAVNKPDVYSIDPGTRLKDVLKMAGGISDEADKLYVSRNYNLAKMVGDQEKIYIPFDFDINNGTFVEQTRTLEYLQPLYLTGNLTMQSASNQTSNNLTISINSASLEELESLPGIGPVTAQKIIDNRPYSQPDELLSKKVVKQSVYNEISSLIQL